MSFFTRIVLTDEQVKQISGNTLTMSGTTDFVGTLKSKGIEINADATGKLSNYVLTYNRIFRFRVGNTFYNYHLIHNNLYFTFLVDCAISQTYGFFLEK